MLFKRRKDQQKQVDVKPSTDPQLDDESRIIEQYHKDKKLLKFFEESKDFRWVKSKNYTGKVYIVNPSECAKNPNFALASLAESFKGTGRTEWEMSLAAILIKAVYEWKVNQDSILADVTELFNRDYVTRDLKKRFTSTQVAMHLERFFKVVETTKGVVYIKWRNDME